MQSREYSASNGICFQFETEQFLLIALSLHLERCLHVDFEGLVGFEQAADLFMEGRELLFRNDAVLDLCVPQVHELHVDILVRLSSLEHIWVRIWIKGLCNVVQPYCTILGK